MNPDHNTCYIAYGGEEIGKEYYDVSLTFVMFFLMFFFCYSIFFSFFCVCCFSFVGVVVVVVAVVVVIVVVENIDYFRSLSLLATAT